MILKINNSRLQPYLPAVKELIGSFLLFVVFRTGAIVPRVYRDVFPEHDDELRHIYTDDDAERGATGQVQSRV